MTRKMAMTKYTIGLEVVGCPQSDLNAIHTRKRRDAAAELYYNIAQWIISATAKRDTESGWMFYYQVKEQCSKIVVNPIAPGRVVEFSAELGGYRITYQGANI